eukprot:scaffold2957_cov57-Cyclotella_meneghiniana.AAC.4
MKKVANANERTASAAALNSITEELHFMVAESPDLDLLERYTLKKKKDNPKLVEDTYAEKGKKCLQNWLFVIACPVVIVVLGTVTNHSRIITMRTSHPMLVPVDHKLEVGVGWDDEMKSVDEMQHQFASSIWFVHSYSPAPAVLAVVRDSLKDRQHIQHRLMKKKL